MNRAERRRMARHTAAPRRRLLAGRPVYSAHVVQAEPGVLGGHVLLGIGDEGELPVAYLELCPTSGVGHLVADLRDVAAPLAEHHCLGGLT